MSNTSNATSYSNWNSDDICFFKTKSHHGSYLELKHLLTEAASHHSEMQKDDWEKYIQNFAFK